MVVSQLEVMVGVATWVAPERLAAPGVASNDKRGAPRRAAMDGPQFDSLVRTFGMRSDRRRTLRLVAAGLLANWGARMVARNAGAQDTPPSDTCAEDAACVDGDLDPCTGGACVDGLCTYFIVDCIPGHVCCGNGECCPADESGGCLADTDCVPMSGEPCEGVRCEGGACVPFLATCAPDFACCGNGTCCPSNGGCVVDSDCPAFPSPWSAGPRCISGVCVPSSALA